MIRPASALYRVFLEKKMSSSWDYGFIYGFISSTLIFTYMRNRENESKIPQHTGEDCLYCKQYYPNKKTSVLQ